MRTRPLANALALACLLAAGACFVMASRVPSGPRRLVPYHVREHAVARARQPGRGSVAAPRAVSPVRRQRVPAHASPPVRVTVPAIGLSAVVVPVGLDAEGRMRMPAPDRAGWYRLGPAPGARGAAVLAGHVDTYRGPAVFYRLTAARAGERVWVRRADGSLAAFTITRVTEVRKRAFPIRAVFGPASGAAIRLITCTGRFDAATGNYLDSLIVWGRRTSLPPPQR